MRQACHKEKPAAKVLETLPQSVRALVSHFAELGRFEFPEWFTDVCSLTVGEKIKRQLHVTLPKK